MIISISKQLLNQLHSVSKDDGVNVNDAIEHAVEMYIESLTIDFKSNSPRELEFTDLLQKYYPYINAEMKMASKKLDQPVDLVFILALHELIIKELLLSDDDRNIIQEFYNNVQK